MEEEGGEWMNTGGCSAAIHFIEVREIFLTSSECSSFLLKAIPRALDVQPLHIVEGNARTRTATTKRAVWWTVSSRMRDDDAGDDDGAAILEGIRPSWLLFSLSI